MLITDKNELKKFGTEYRVWQGIPGIEVTDKGRIFAAFYSGGTKETYGNFVVLEKSDDNGKTWSEPIAVAYKSQFYRCYDQCLWIDPLGRLWFIWSIMPEYSVYAVICDEPDADELVWSDERLIGHDIMLNKPTVLSSGEWLFPIAVWRPDVKILDDNRNGSTFSDSAPNLYKTVDNGETFTKIKGPDITSRIFDEHMTVELSNGSLMMLVRTTYGIAMSISYDSGVTWTREKPFNMGGPCSRFHIVRLKSGRMLLVNHYHFTGRNNLTALLSEDDGKTWKYSLMLDERDNVAYPDVKEASDGFIYITYDRERGGFKNSYEEARKEAREILMAKITEEDIIEGKLVNSESKVKCVISKLGDYNGDAEQLFSNTLIYTKEDVADLIVNEERNSVVLEKLFSNYTINCQNMHSVDIKRLDSLIEDIRLGALDRMDGMEKINNLLKNSSTSANGNREEPIVETVLEYIADNYAKNINLAELAQSMGISVYYLSHVFKKKVGMSILKYRDEYRIKSAKQMLLETDASIADISDACGYYEPAYFIKCFRKKENVTPFRYRQLKKK